MVFRGTRAPSSRIPLPDGEAKDRGKRGASRIVIALSAAVVLLAALVVVLLVLR